MSSASRTQPSKDAIAETTTRFRARSAALAEDAQKTDKALRAVLEAAADWMEISLAENPDLQVLTSQEKNMYRNQERFMAAFGRFGSDTQAARAVNLTPQAVWYWEEKDSLGFRDRKHGAHRIHNDYINEMILSRLEDPTGNRGSDILLMFYGKGHNPTMWRELPPKNDDAWDALKELRQMAVRQRKATLTIEETVVEPLPVKEAGE